MSPESPALLGFLTGVQTAGYFAVALFFARFWRKSRDGLFLTFSLAFLLLAIGQPIPLLFGIPNDVQSPAYLIRLAAFGLIIVAIVRKNADRNR